MANLYNLSNQQLSYLCVHNVCCRFTPLVPFPDSKNNKCYETTAVFLLSCFQYISVAFVFTPRVPFRQPIYKQRKFQFVNKWINDLGKKSLYNFVLTNCHPYPGYPQCNHENYQTNNYFQQFA